MSKKQFPFNGHAVCDLATFWAMMARVILGCDEISDIVDADNCIYHPGWMKNVQQAVESREIPKLRRIFLARDQQCPLCNLAQVRDLEVTIGTFGWRVEAFYENVTWTCLPGSDRVNIEWVSSPFKDESWLKILSAILLGMTDVVSHDVDDEDIDADEEAVGM